MQKDTETIFFKHPWRIFFFEVFLFSLTLVLGISAAYRINQFFGYQKIEVVPVSPWRFILTFFLTTIILFLLIRFLTLKKKGATLFKLLFVFAIFSGGVLFFDIWLSTQLAVILMGFLIFWWLMRPSVLIQDLCMILGMAGVGVALGLQLTPSVVMIILIVLSIYDWIAVYKTKHMVKIAKEMLKAGAISALIIPQTISGFKNSLTDIRPGGNFLILGGGDVVFPLLFSVSLISYGILKSSIVAFFSLIGLFFNFYVFLKQKDRKPMPALPLIAFFSIVGYLITLLI
ncbi:hypothetical protein AMJ49_00485 [Parcubacteria bacterium DG_74_2]|nr:MAG: hypothetical protein AMJ49_00485 [Parcubacteria bacterium DG_74_2]